MLDVPAILERCIHAYKKACDKFCPLRVKLLKQKSKQLQTKGGMHFKKKLLWWVLHCKNESQKHEEDVNLLMRKLFSQCNKMLSSDRKITPSST